MKSKTKDKDKIKLKIYRALQVLFFVLSLTSTALSVILECWFIEGYIHIILLNTSTMSLILCLIFYFLTDKYKRIVMNNSIEYYKQRLSFCGMQAVIIAMCILFSFILIIDEANIDFDAILNITISLTSLNFLVLTFIVPFMKTRIDQLMKNLKTKSVDVKGKVYHTIQKYNQAYIIVFISVVLFFMYILSNMLFSKNYTHFYLLSSLLYSSYVLITLIISIKTIFWINLKDVEDKLENKETKK